MTSDRSCSDRIDAHGAAEVGLGQRRAGAAERGAGPDRARGRGGHRCSGCRTPTIVYGFGDWLTNAGRITGLLAGYAIVVLLALMARVPALERGVGTDRLARWHAMGGRYTVSLAVAHTLLIIWGYAVTAHTNVVHQTRSLITSYPDVLMATVAVLLLVAVGIASARAARRRLRYETWHFIHLYTYLAIALAFSHQFSTGADFVSQRQGSLAVVGALHRRRRCCCSGTAWSPRSAAAFGTGCAWSGSCPRSAGRGLGLHRAAGISTSSAPNPGSSSAGGSSPGSSGGPPIRIRCRLHRGPTCCG